MSGFQLDTTFTDTTLPIGESLAAGILANGDLDHWFQADAGHLALTADVIDTWVDRAASGKSLTKTTGGATLQDTALGAYQAALFDDANPDVYTLSGGTIPWTGAFTIAAVARLDDLASGDREIIGASSSYTFFLGRTGTTTLRLRCGAGQNNDIAFPNDGNWFSLLASYDGSGTTHIALNGGTPKAGVGADPAVVGGTVLGAATLGGNFPWSGNISDLIIWSTDLFAGGNAAELARVNEYFASAYGIG
ncbi:MAG: LamG domain-containing protein [Rhodobacteraceae bacterium]|nr:LamG domain-containing protein [Paracoccaceae bacterium]